MWRRNVNLLRVSCGSDQIRICHRHSLLEVHIQIPFTQQAEYSNPLPNQGFVISHWSCLTKEAKWIWGTRNVNWLTCLVDKCTEVKLKSCLWWCSSSQSNVHFMIYFFFIHFEFYGTPVNCFLRWELEMINGALGEFISIGHAYWHADAI